MSAPALNVLEAPRFLYYLDGIGLSLDDIHSINASCAVGTNGSPQALVYQPYDDIDESLYYLDEWLVNVEHGLIQNKNCYWTSIFITFQLPEEDQQIGLLYAMPEAFVARPQEESSDLLAAAAPPHPRELACDWEQWLRFFDMIVRRTPEHINRVADPTKAHAYKRPMFLRHTSFGVGRLVDLFIVEATCGASSLVFHRRDHCDQATPEELLPSIEDWLADLRATFEGQCENIGVRFFSMDGYRINDWRRVALPRPGGVERPFPHAEGFALDWEPFADGLRGMEWTNCAGELTKPLSVLSPSEEWIANWMVHAMLGNGSRIASRIVFQCPPYSRSDIDLAALCASGQPSYASQPIRKNIEDLRDLYRYRDRVQNCSILDVRSYD